MRVSRKLEHVEQALRLAQTGRQGFSDYRLVHNCLPETALDSVSLQTWIGDLTLSSPIIINAMTGGAPETASINEGLAIAARENGLAMAVGSQMSAIRNAEAADSYRIARRVNPGGLLFANLGSEATLEQALSAIEMIRADAIQIHLNVMQELVMPEGDRCFQGMLERIARIREGSPVPVIIKEVGFGMLMESASRLLGEGISILDVGGSGGTNFAAIENARRIKPILDFNDWGASTGIALLETVEAVKRSGARASVIASGGIAGSLHAAKALAAGASAVGVAGAFLRILKEDGTAALVQLCADWQQELRLLMTVLGAADIPALQRAPLVITGYTREWCRARGIDSDTYARRGM